MLLRQKILRKCREDIYHFFDRENGQVAIYDAVNPISSGRRALAKEFAKHDIQVIPSRCSAWTLGNVDGKFQTLFIESVCTDERIIEENVRNVKISSPDVGEQSKALSTC